MRAAVMRDRTLVIDEVPDPEPSTGEVLVKTLACGICGSDLHALRHADEMVAAARETDAPFLMDPSQDVVMGHEFCAEILDHGPNTFKKVPAGERVVSMPVLFRGTNVEGVGYSNVAPGGYGERMVLSEMFVLPVPNGLSTEHAALTEPMAVGLHAVNKARLGERDAPLVVGCGPVGLAVIAALKLQGRAPIVASDFSPMRRKLAEAMGADVVLDPAAEDVPAAFAKASKLRPAVIFECVGVPGMLRELMRQAPREARLVVVGVCMQEDTVRPMVGVNKELALQFVLGYTPEEFQATLQALGEGAVDVTPLLTAKVGIGQVPWAFEQLERPEEHAKILVEPWRD